jgi:DNA-binding NarL/FixJ family response regulator
MNPHGTIAFTAVEPPAAAPATATDGRDVTGRRIVAVSDQPTAAAALALALEGESLVLHATAPRQVLDRLYDDLRRLGPVEIHASDGVVPPRGSAALEPEDMALLRLLAAGESLRQAARQLHLSTRTADRRLARARATLGVATTAEAVSAIRR